MLKRLIGPAQAALFISIIFCGLLTGCSGSGSNSIILKSVDDNIQISAVTIYNGTENILHELDEKTKDSATHRRADIWLSRALQAREITLNFYNYLDSLKKIIGDKSNNIVKDQAGNVEMKFNTSQRDLLAIDSEIAKLFDGSLASFDKLKEESGNIAKAFRNSSGLEARVLLGNLQLIARSNENRIIQYCRNKIGDVCGLMFDVYAALVSQSTSVLQQGESIEISAGLGSFSRKAKPIIVIDGKKVEIGDDAVARYTILAGKPGKHSVDVRVKYMNQETGLPAEVGKRIEYTVH